MSFLCRKHGALSAIIICSSRACSFVPKIIVQPSVSGNLLRTTERRMSRWNRSGLLLRYKTTSAVKTNHVLEPWSSCLGSKHLRVSRQAMATSSDASGRRHQNRLALEKSPYLLQHASNPVDWYPWGSEAMQKAKAENKPIFLSVGYSTCHWCHVMERESFESQEIAEVLNKFFVSIKVDREERPDVDRVYMTFVQATTGSGGWPMSVWLTPDLKPIFGGTYFPPDERYYNRTGFKTLLLMIAEKWKSSRSAIEDQGTAVLDALMRGTHMEDPGVAEMPTLQVLDKLYEMLKSSYDELYGGFGKAPKFPQPVNFNALFRLYSMERTTEKGETALNMCLHTLRMMAKGGIHDHVAQGFHRYSTDQVWHVPHFEKMLYDQGQLAVSYIDAYQITKEEVFAEVARNIFEYVNRDLSHPEGGFYSAEDADSLPTAESKEKKEGAFCVWTWAELQALLAGKVGAGDDGPTLAEVFCHHYSCREEGNVDPLQDPHEELKLQNVLMVKGDVEQTATKLGLEVQAVNNALQKCRQILFDKRQERPKPHLDNKMVSAWNGLMISGMARGGQVLGDNELTGRAVKAAEFLQLHLYREDDNMLLRSCYTSMDGGVAQISKPIEGFVDDYAFVIRGLLDLYEASLDERWLKWCHSLQTRQDQLFWDEEGGGYYSSQDGDASIVLRMKEDQDGAEPSPNSVSCANLLRLASYLDCPELSHKAERILHLFAKRLTTLPVATPELVCALALHLQSSKQIVIVGPRDAEDTKAMLQAVHSRFIPNKVLMLVDGSKEGFLYERVELLKSLHMLEGKATAYVCEHFACSAPTNCLEQLEQQLDSC